MYFRIWMKFRTSFVTKSIAFIKIFSSWISFERTPNWFVIDFYDFMYSVFPVFDCFPLIQHDMNGNGMAISQHRFYDLRYFDIVEDVASGNPGECIHFNCESIQVYVLTAECWESKWIKCITVYRQACSLVQSFVK